MGGRGGTPSWGQRPQTPYSFRSENRDMNREKLDIALHQVMASMTLVKLI
jgi:hypothetical protein